MARYAEHELLSMRVGAALQFGANVSAYVDGNQNDAVKATLSTALTGSNNDLDYTAVAYGTGGNSITIAYVDPAGNNQALAVSVATNAISVSLATDGGGAITSTAAQVKAAIEASAAAAALVTVANKSGNDGTGVVTALTATALSGGANQTVADVQSDIRANSVLPMYETIPERVARALGVASVIGDITTTTMTADDTVAEVIARTNSVSGKTTLI